MNGSTLETLVIDNSPCQKYKTDSFFGSKKKDLVIRFV